MSKTIAVIILLMLVSSCQKKRPAEPQVLRMDNYIPPATEAEIDTTHGYISPIDAFSDRTPFSSSDFQSVQINYRGTRNVFYHITRTPKNNLTIVIEYLNGAWKNGDTTSTATRVLLYSETELLYRKAFSPELSDAVNFLTVRKFGYKILAVSSKKSIVYYWFDKIRIDGSVSKEYHAVSVNQEGITNELFGDITLIGGSYGSMRFLSESRLYANVPPNIHYPYLAIDLYYTIDWNSCTASLDIPNDTIFTVTEQPSRFFNAKIKLYSSPQPVSPYRETNYRRLTKAQVQKIFVPSLFDVSNIVRDHLFIEFNKTTKGWINYETMKFEEVISEN